MSDYNQTLFLAKKTSLSSLVILSSWNCSDKFVLYQYCLVGRGCKAVKLEDGICWSKPRTSAETE